MNYRAKSIVWGVIFLVIATFLYAVSEILFPFVMAFVLAYFLDPIVSNTANRFKIPRATSVILVLLIFFSFLTLAMFLILPILYDQFITFLDEIPDYKMYFEKLIMPALYQIFEKVDPNITVKIEESIQAFSGTMFNYLSHFMTNMIDSGFALLNVLSLIFITPIVMFYIMKEYPRIVHKLDDLLPRNKRSVILGIIQEIDTVLAGYIRGQLNVCIIMGLFYALVLVYLDIEYGILIGFAAGFFTFIPYVGVSIGALTAMVVSFVQHGDLSKTMLILMIFIIGQTIEGYLLLPRFVGNRIGIHPAWMIFAMLAGASLIGFVGILIAVPLAGILGVLVKFAMKIYFNSDIYEDRRNKKKSI